jgi:hypothetical protein
VTDASFADLIRLVDELEARAESYLTLADIESVEPAAIDAAIQASILLVDQRTRLDVATGHFESVALCRLNRQHTLVKQLTGW